MLALATVTEHAAVAQDAFTPTPATQTASQPAGLLWELSPSIYPEGVHDEEHYLREVHAQCEGYAALAREAADPAQAVESELAAANLILARETEPFASRRLLGLSQPEDEASMRSALASARRRLGSAADRLENWVDEDVPGRDRHRDRLETLQSFATALEAVWRPGDDEAAAQTRRDGVVSLAVLLEHERKDVASAAAVWQAVLYRQLGRPDRALELLPLATDRAEREARTYQLLSRLLRCRLIADRGGYAAACALLLQIEERIVEWFGTDEARAAAAHAAMLTRVQVLALWRDTLDPATEADEIQWCNRAIERIHGDAAVEGGSSPVLRLEETIPLIVPLPEGPGPTPRTLPARRHPGDE
ncbi:MAG: hypothetical protein V2A79_15950 [Planctomycetota bacterium]